mgnify:CR=1 FL=1
MKKLFFLFTLSLLLVSVAWGQGLEDFTNSNATSNYGTRSFVGNNGITWSYVASRDGNGDANESGIDLPALMLRRSSDNSAITSSTISSGIGNFSVKLYKGFTGAGNRQVELFVNGVTKGTSVSFDDFDEHIFQVNDINVAGDVVIEIANKTSNQVIIDDISWTGYASSTPTISVNPTTLSGFTYILGSGPSAEQSFVVSGTNLTDDITISIPTNYEISDDTGENFQAAINPIILTQTAGEVNQTIYVRLKAGLAGGTYNEDISLTSTDADPLSISLVGEVIEPIPAVFVDPAVLSGFIYYVEEGPSAEQSFTVSGEFLDGNVSLSVTADYEISSVSGESFSSTLTLSPSAGYLGETAVYVRQVAGLPIGSYSGTVTISALNVTDLTVDLSGAVEAAPEPAKNLFFSEYIEGSSNNKALEVYNASGADVNLADYKLVLYSNGAATPGNTLQMEGTLAAGAVYVVANAGSNQAILELADVTSSVTYYNGDDAVALVYVPDESIIDQIGEIGVDPGSAWPVAGVSKATVEHTLIRKPTVDTGNTDWAAQQGTDAEDSEWIVMPQDYIANLGTHSYGMEVAVAPVFNPPAGTYLAAIDVSIESETEGATIYYTTDGSEPSDTNGSIYSSLIDVSETTTIKAIAYAEGFLPSLISTATYSIPVSVENIAELRAQTTGASNVYTLTGEAVLTYQNANRNTKYIQDATAAIVIDDPATAITTAYMDYDGITGITGTLGVYNGLLQFTPVVDPGEATSSNNVVEPEVRTLASLISADQAKLIKITDATISGATQFPSYASNLTITDASATGTLRTFPNTDYAGTDVPTDPVNIICLVGQYNDTMQISPRYISDFEDAADIPDGEATTVGGATVTISGGSANIVPDGVIPAYPNSSITVADQFVLQLIGAGPWTITIQTDQAWGSYYTGGMWHAVESVDGIITFTVTASKDLILPVVLANDTTLPVELSSFTAVMNSDNHAVISWVTQTETGVSGYYVLRNSVEDLETALQISALIEAANTSQEHTYSFIDEYIYEPGTYYYWLHVVDIDGTEDYSDPISVVYEYQEPEVPVIPQITEFKNVYPNPFNPNTNISYALSDQQDVTFSIYNSRGQLVRQYDVGSKAAGNYSLVWDGTDYNGRTVTTGVYFIRMQAGRDSFFKKAVLMK